MGARMSGHTGPAPEYQGGAFPEWLPWLVLAAVVAGIIWVI